MSASINAPLCIACDEDLVEGEEGLCPACARELAAEESKGSPCPNCSNRGCRSAECARAIRAEQRAEEDRDDPGARGERLLARLEAMGDDE